MKLLYRARLSLGLSVTDMAAVLGVHRNTYDKWERGERKPGAITYTTLELLLLLNPDQRRAFLSKALN